MALSDSERILTICM